jgi:oxygen-independent coproporphyrinogen III oxidase
MLATQTDHTLFKKYDVPGPRYTSYPTILHWDSTPSPDSWLESVRGSLDLAERHGTGAAIYIHVPYCRSLCTYCGCNSRITTKTSVAQPYIKTVLKEWQLYVEGLGSSTSIPLTELHLGGGTPTFLSAPELEQLIGGILKDVRRTSDAEFSIESDPRVTRPEQLQTLARLGFKRLSLGIQDFDPRVQLAVNRIQSEKQVETVTETARANGFTSINYDLIYGLPFQTLDSIRTTIEAVMRLRPDRIAFYGYAHVPWVKPGQRHFTEADLPSGDEKRALYEFGREMLAEAGYREIGMDHFALTSDSLWETSLDGRLHRNFMGYTSRFVNPLIGLGVSSISDSWDMFVQNEKIVEAYIARVEAGELPFFRGHQLTKEDCVLRRHILNLMTRFKTSWDEPELYVPHLRNIGDGLDDLRRDGLIEFTSSQCRVTDEGRPFLRNICMKFDAHLARDSAAKQFSRTI